MNSIKSLESIDLFKLLKSVVAEAEKKSKQTKSITKTTTKKSGSMPKGAVPHQLKKPRAWVEYTLKNALENGWESFTILQKKKDKETNIVTEEHIEMSGSILHNGSHIYENSITDKFPDGKRVIHKEAMSLSKQRKGTSHSTYAEFDAQYIDDTPDDKSVISSTSSKKIVEKKTQAEKEAESEAKKVAKVIEKEANKVEKETEKRLKKASVVAAKEVVTKEVVTKDVVTKDVATKEVVRKEVAAKEVVKTVVAKKKPVIKTPEPEVTVKEVVKTVVPKKKDASNEIPDDGMVHPWTYKTKKYLRNADGETWTVGVDGAVGTWVGIFKDNKIDTSAPEPVFDDEE